MRNLILRFISYIASFFLKNISKKDEKGLTLFSQNYCLGNLLSEVEARKNIEFGLVEIVYPDGEHCANGLLVTNNGFLVINEHCLEVIMDCKIKTKDGKIHNPTDILWKNKDKDIALIKINLNGSKEPIIYKFINHFSLQGKRTSIFHLSVWNSKTKYMFGSTYGAISDFEVYREECRKDIFKSMFRYTSSTQKGDSGGVVVDENGGLIGIHCSGGINGTIKECSCCTVFDILEMISAYCYKKP